MLFEASGIEQITEITVGIKGRGLVHDQRIAPGGAALPQLPFYQIRRAAMQKFFPP